MARPYEKYIDPITCQFTLPYQLFAIAVSKLSQNHDCNQIARALDAGMTPEECAKMAEEEHAERETEPFGDPLDHDFSMNA